MTRFYRKQLIWLLATVMLGGGLLLIEVVRAGDPAAPRLKNGPAVEPDDDHEEDEEEEELKPGEAPKLKKLTPEEISRIRYMELRAMRLDTNIPDRVRVTINKDTIDEFMIEMEGHPHFRGKKNRREFLKLTPPQKLHIIAKYQGAGYADKVEIENDPEVFVEFRRHVLPTVLRTCATSGCHSPSNEEAFGFRLFKDPKRTDATIYANFITLNDLETDHTKMIDRGQPENSLLLTYMLPRKDVKVELRHPGDVDYKAPFQSRKNQQFRRIQKWIASLKHPAEDYGVRLIPKPPFVQEEEEMDEPGMPTSRPSGDTKTEP